MDPAKRARLRIDLHSSILQSNHAQYRFRSGRAEDDLSHGLSADEAHSREPVLVFHRLPAGELVNSAALRTNAGFAERLRWRHAIHGACINQKLGRVTLSSAGKLADGGRDVRDAHDFDDMEFGNQQQSGAT